MLYYFKKGENATEIQKKKDLCSVWRRCWRMCQKWFAKLHAGDFLLDDAPWSGRPVEVDNDQIDTLMENNQPYTGRR